MADRKNIEDIYRLSELQEAMLMHRLRDQTADSGILLLRATLTGAVDLTRLQEAWNATLRQHPVLRSSVHWHNLKHPVQVVAVNAQLGIELLDWRHLEARESDADLEQLIEHTRQLDLDVTKAPVMKLILVRLGDQHHKLLWVCHHLLLDGWSSALVLNEVISRYRDGGTRSLPSPRPFRDYVAWSRRRDPESATGLWAQLGCDAREVLATPLLCSGRWRGTARIDQQRSSRPLFSGTELERWTRRQRATTGSLVLGCWALTLAEATGSEQAVFGVTTSGRGADLEGIEESIGMFAGVLPFFVSIDNEQSVDAWARQLLEIQQGLQAFDAWPLGRLFEASGVALRRPPFDTLLTYASFPAFDAGQNDEVGETTGLELSDYRGDVTSAFPLTLAMVPSADGNLLFEAHFDSTVLPPNEVKALLGRFQGLLETLIVDSPATLGALRATAPGRLIKRQLSEEPAAAVRALGGTDAQAATTATEAQLMRIWNDLITVQEYGVDDNFFSLGGHSLLVPQMIARIELDFGTVLPLGTVFENATVRGLAAVLDGDETASSWQPLVAIRPRGKKRPLFMVHGLGGEVGWFYNLANYLNPDLPLFGLQAPPEPLENLEQMASLYLEEVRRQQPSGPYRLGGYCIGGGVAFEMARQLESQGESCDALMMIDSVPQAHISGQQDQSARGLADRLGHLLAKEPREIVRSTQDFARRAGRRLAHKLPGSGETPLELDHVLDMDTLPQVYHRASRSHFRAMRDYQPGPFGGDVWLLRTHDERFGEDFGWRTLVLGELNIERIPGRHVDVLKEPHVQVVGRKLNAALDASPGGAEA